MKITYTLWQGNTLLAVNQYAKNSQEILDVLTELNKLGKGFHANVREVDTK